MFWKYPWELHRRNCSVCGSVDNLARCGIAAGMGSWWTNTNQCDHNAWQEKTSLQPYWEVMCHHNQQQKWHLDMSIEESYFEDKKIIKDLLLSWLLAMTNCCLLGFIIDVWRKLDVNLNWMEPQAHIVNENTVDV